MIELSFFDSKIKFNNKTYFKGENFLLDDDSLKIIYIKRKFGLV